MGLIWLVSLLAALGDGLPRTVTPWRAAAGGGVHRARFHIDEHLLDGPCALDVPWRLPLGLGVREHALTVRDEHGRALKHIAALEVSEDRAVLLLRARAAGTHYLYFLPYDPGQCAETGPASACRLSHTRGAPSRPPPRWLPAWAHNHTFGAPLSAHAREQLATLARARVVAIEAQSARDAFAPMEVRATAAELAALRSRAAGRRLLLFAEPPKRPIRMRDAPPAEWLRDPAPPNSSAIALEAGGNAYVAFQIAALALAPRAPLRGLAVAFDALRHASPADAGSARGERDVALGARAFSLLNRCGGHAAYLDALAGSPSGGSAAAAGGAPRRASDAAGCDGGRSGDHACGLAWVASNQASVPSGGVGVLWVAADLPPSLRAGHYTTRVWVRADGVAAEYVTVRLRVTSERLPHRGDEDPAGHSRLRWLESRVGMEAVPTRNYEDVEWAFGGEARELHSAGGSAGRARSRAGGAPIWLRAGDKALRFEAGAQAAAAVSGAGGLGAREAAADELSRAMLLPAALRVRGVDLLASPMRLLFGSADGAQHGGADGADARPERAGASAQVWALHSVRAQRAPSSAGERREGEPLAERSWEAHSGAAICWSAAVVLERQPAAGALAGNSSGARDMLEVSVAASFEFDGYAELQVSLRALRLPASPAGSAARPPPPPPLGASSSRSAPASARSAAAPPLPDGEEGERRGGEAGGAREARDRAAGAHSLGGDATLILDDFALEVALRPAVAQLASGLGRPGGALARYLKPMPAARAAHGVADGDANLRERAEHERTEHAGGSRRRLPAETFADGGGGFGLGGRRKDAADGVGQDGLCSGAVDEWAWSWADLPAAANRRPGLNGRLWLGSTSAGLQLSLAPRAGFDDGATLAAPVEAACDSDGGSGSDRDHSVAGQRSSERSGARARQRSAAGLGASRSSRLDCGLMASQQYDAALGSASWANGGRGRIRVVRRAAGERGEPEAVVVTVSTGMLKLVRGAAAVRFPARLLLTPVRPAPLRAPVRSRHFHMQRLVPVEAAAAHVPGGTIIIHQGHELNPYINYPFLRTAELAEYVRQAHGAGMRVKLYYTTRELSASAPEFWALRSLGSEAIVPGARGGHAWLQEHVRTGYNAAWHERLSDGSMDMSVSTSAFASRLDSYWLEGIAHLIRTVGIDGIYLDGAPYERRTLQRLRRLADALHPSFELDLHASCAANPRLPYAELLPMLDSIWFGEQCAYAEMAPDQWLADVSGVPYGIPAEVLTDEGARWAALVFGMTCRIYPEPRRCEPRPLWEALERIGASDSALVGFWEAQPLVVVRGRDRPSQSARASGGDAHLTSGDDEPAVGSAADAGPARKEPLVRASLFLGGAWLDAALGAAKARKTSAANGSAPLEDAASAGHRAWLADAARMHWRRVDGAGPADAHDGRVLPLPIAVAVASWEAASTVATLSVDWPALGLCALGARLVAAAVRGFQAESEWAGGAEITFGAQRSGQGEGYLLQLHAARANTYGCDSEAHPRAQRQERRAAEAPPASVRGRADPAQHAARGSAASASDNGALAGTGATVRVRARTVWQLNDVHLQQGYTEGASIFRRCTPEAGAAGVKGATGTAGGAAAAGGDPDRVPHAGGVPSRPFGAAGLFGDNYCDSPPRLLESALAHINTTHAVSAERALRPLILLSGDWVMSNAGGRSPVSDDAVRAAPFHVAAALARQLPSARAFPLWGNHDLLPYNTHLGRAGVASAAAAHAFAPWIGARASCELAGRGYYALDIDADFGVATPAATLDLGASSDAGHVSGRAAPARGVRLLALNTALFSPSNSAAHSASGLAAARMQLHWLGAQLRELVTNRGSALIVGHEPPGTDWYTSRGRSSPVASWWIPEHAREYAELVSRFSAAVALQTFGHTHADELRIIAPPREAGIGAGESQPPLEGSGQFPGHGARAGGGRSTELDGSGERSSLRPRAFEPAGAERASPAHTVAFIAPPLTPYGAAFNPAVRAYVLEPSSWQADAARQPATGAVQLRDFTQWVLLLESSNVLREAIWQIEYVASRAYGLDDMSAQSWRGALGRMHEPRSIELARYVAHANVWDQGRERFASIDGARAMLCGAAHVDPGTFARCRDDVAGGVASAPQSRPGDVLPSASSLEEEGMSAVWATLPRGTAAS